MAGSGPWSVKGIDPKARAAAKLAAQRRGMTLGEWLSNKMLEPDANAVAPYDQDRQDLEHLDSNVSNLSGLYSSRSNSISSNSLNSPVGGDHRSADDNHLFNEIENLARRLEATEHRSTLAITGIDQTVLGLLSKLEDIEVSQQDVSERLEKSLQTLDVRLGESNKEVEGFATKFSRELKDTARRVDTLGEQSDTQASKLRHEVGKDVELINTRSDEISQRLALAEKQTDAAIRTLEASFVSIDSRLKKAEQSINQNSNVGLSKKFDDQFSVISRELVRVVAETRGQLAAQIEAQAANPKLASMEDSLREMRQKFANTENRHANTLEQIAVAVSKLGGAVENRLQESEDRSESRLKEFQDEQAEALERVGRSMADVAQRLEARFERIDKAEQDKAAENDLDERLRASEVRTAQLVEDALQRVHQRLDETSKSKDDELSPVQQALSKLTDRLSAIEERSTPPFVDVQDDIESANNASTAVHGEGQSYDGSPENTGELVTAPPSQFSSGYGEISSAFDQPSLPPLTGADDLNFDPGLNPDIGGPDYDAVNFTNTGSNSNATIGATAGPDFMASARRSVLEMAQASQGSVYQTGPAAPTRPETPGLGGANNRKLLVVSSVFAIVAIGAAASVAMLDFGGGKSVARMQVVQQQDVRYGDLDPVLDGSDAIVQPITVAAIEPKAHNQTLAATANEPAETSPPASNPKSMSETYEAAPKAVVSAPPKSVEKRPAAPVTAPITSPDRSFANNNPEPANIYQPSVRPTSKPNPVKRKSPQIMPAVIDDPNAPISLIRAKTPAQRPSLQQAAQAGDPIAQYQYASSLADSGQDAQAAVFMKRAAQRGLPAAQYQLARYYENGTGLGVDENEARRWTERAANGGNRRAMHNLAMFHAEGRTVPQSYEAAAKWFEEAALLGLANSQFNLALLYEQGLGVPKSIPDAYAWYSIAAKAGDRGAGQKLEELKTQIPEQALKEAKIITERFSPRPLDLQANGVFRNVNWARPQADDPTSISRAQLLLARMGYKPGPADGNMGENTRLAVIAYERDNGLAQTGRIDQALLSKLESGAMN